MQERVMENLRGVGLAVGLAAAVTCSAAACGSDDHTKSGSGSGGHSATLDAGTGTGADTGSAGDGGPDNHAGSGNAGSGGRAGSTGSGATAGTGPSGSGGTPSLDAGSLPETLTELVNAECALSATCCGKAGQPTPNEATCRAKVTQSLASVRPFLEQGQAALDEAQVKRCIALLASIQSKCDPAPYAGMRGVCANLFVGTVPEKGRCEGGNTCAHGANAGAICLRNFNSDAGANAGVCAPLLYGKAGDDCLLTLDENSGGSVSADFAGSPGDVVACRRDDGLYCDSSTHQCTKLVEKDGSCVSAECASGYECVQQTCLERKGLGEACSSDAPCRAEWTCDNGKCVFTLTDTANCSI